MRKTAFFCTAALLAVLPFTACSSGNKPAESPKTETKAAEAPKPPDLTTGREEFQRLFGSARGWSPDAKPFRLQSETVTDAPGHDGKAGVWRASFASAARANIKSWVWSGVGDPKERGINPGTEDTYNPNNASTKVFDFQFLKIDSEKAFEVAQGKGGGQAAEGKSEAARVLCPRLG